MPLCGISVPPPGMEPGPPWQWKHWVLTMRPLGNSPSLCSYFCSIAQSCPTLQLHGLQHSRPPCPSLSLRVCSNSCLLSWWCYLTISSSATFFSFGLQSFPASGSFPVSWLFALGGSQSTGNSSVLPMNIQGWFQNSSFEYCISPLTQDYWSFFNLFILSFFLIECLLVLYLVPGTCHGKREIIQNFNCEWKDGLKKWNRKKPGS